MSLNIERVVVRLDKVNTTIASDYTATCKEYAEDAAASAASSLSYSGAAQSYASQAGEAYSQTILAAQVNSDAVETVNAAVIDVTASALAASASADTAVDAANTATTKAGEAATYASTISASVSTCATSANTCSTKAGEALASANAAAISEANAAIYGSAIAPHIANKSNPHEVTAAQVGATPIAHATDTDNPHSVTKSQIGLSNVTDDAQVKRSEIGVASGVASLGEDGKVPTVQLPAMSGDTCSTQITNAGTGVWSNGTIESAVSSVDVLGGSGNFETDADVALWTAGGGATLTRDAGNHYSGVSCLRINNVGAVAGYAYRQITGLTIGHVYKIVCMIRPGSASAAQLYVSTAPGLADIAYLPSSSVAAYVRQELTFEATATSFYVSFWNTATLNGNCLYDALNIYDMGVNLVTNGTFNSNTTGWTAGNGATLASVAGGINGNQLSVSGVSGGYAYQQVTGLTPGKLYRLSGWTKGNGTNTQTVGVSAVSPGSYELGLFQYTLASHTYGTILFESPSNGTVVVSLMNGGTTAAEYYDSITLAEVTVGCVGYNSKALDLWAKDLSAVCFRETINTKAGAYYALRVYNGSVYWSDGGRAAKPEFYARYAGRAAAIGVWVRCSSANKSRIGITDSTGTTWSSYHSGGGSYEWLEVTRTPGTGITSFNVVVDSGTGTEAQFSQPQLMFGASVGTGNFVPIPGEVISTSAKASYKFSTWAALSAQPFSAINVTVDSMGAIPKGARSVLLRLAYVDTGAVGRTCAVNSLGPVGGSVPDYTLPSFIASDVGIYITSTSTNTVAVGYGIVPVNDGQIYSGFQAQGTGTAYVLLHYTGVQL